MGPRLRFQFTRREPQRPARPVVRRPETTVVEEILEECGAGAENDGVRRDLDGREEVEGGIDMINLNRALLF